MSSTPKYTVGCSDGAAEGSGEGDTVGAALGSADGAVVGSGDGDGEGSVEGAGVGAADVCVQYLDNHPPLLLEFLLLPTQDDKLKELRWATAPSQPAAA